MRFTITSSNSRNTEFVADDGALWYTVETPWSIGHRTTTLTRTVPGPHCTVGQIHWRNITGTRVQIGQTILDRKDFLQGKGVFGGHRLMIGADGQQYEWKHINSEPELWSLATGRCVAHYKSRNILKGRKGQLVIEREAERTMDVIIIAFTILDKEKKNSDGEGKAGSTAWIGANVASAAAAIS